MVTGIIGRKVGMTQIFDAEARASATGSRRPCVVVQSKDAQTDGYEAVQIGFVEETPAKSNKPTAGHFKKANVPPTRVKREVGLASGAEKPEGRRSGAGLDLRRRRARRHRRHRPRQGVPGRGQAPPLRRRRRDARLDVPRAPGSIGASSFPSRVVSRACAPPDAWAASGSRFTT